MRLLSVHRCACGAGAVILFAAATIETAQAQFPAFLEKESPRQLRLLCYNVNWDSIFPDGDPDNHPWREYDMSEEFVRILTAVQPDIVCLQEINDARDPQDVADILETVLPLGPGRSWQAHKGSDNVIATPFALSLLRTDTTPTTNRGQAMALLDLPDATFPHDLYLMNAHFKASGGSSNIARRQQHADAIIHWIDDIKTPGGYINLPAGTPVITLGDLNVYDTDPHLHLYTLITGDVDNEATYGPDAPPDWDDTDNTDTLPLHNGVGPDFYTWRNDSDPYNPGALDRIIYPDSAMAVAHSFVLNTTIMTPAELQAAGLEVNDVVLYPYGGNFDHLPLIVDLLLPAVAAGDYDLDGDVDLTDFIAFPACLSGSHEAPGFTLPSLGCRDIFDLDADSDIDLADFSLFQSSFAGS